jgi:hypothetical protein
LSGALISILALGVGLADAGAPPPAVPAGGLTPARPPAFCEISGRVDGDGLELSGTAYGRPLARISDGQATLAFSEGGAVFAEVRLPSSAVVRGPLRPRIFSATLRGERRALAAVRARRWLAFGGVLQVGAGARMLVEAVRDGKLVVVPFDSVRGFRFLEAQPTLEVSCADLSLDPDADGALRKAAPPAALADGKAREMWLAPGTTTRVSADADGPPIGSFTSDDDEPLRVSLLERRGDRARIRRGHVVGWMDAGLLKPKAAKTSKARPALTEVAGTTGLLGMLSGRGPEADERVATASPQTEGSRRLSCRADVQLVAELGRAATSPRGAAGPPARFVLGVIPAGRPFRVAESGAEVSYLSTSNAAVSPAANARLAVVTSELAGCDAATGAGADALGAWTAADHAKRVAASRKPDALDALDKNDAPASEYDPFGVADGGTRALSERGARPAAFPGVHASPTTSRELAGPGRLSTEVIDRVLRRSLSSAQLCYDKGLRADPDLAGRVTARFTIEAGGSVSNVSDAGSDLPNAETIRCVLGALQSLTFPRPEGGPVTATIPLLLTAD